MAVRWRQLSDWCVYILIRVFICIVQAFSLEACQTVARVLAWVAADVARLRYRVVADNLRHVYPHWDDAHLHRFIRRMWEHLFMMVAEVAQARQKIHETSFRRYVTFADKPLLVRYLLDPRPTVLVTGHYGNFEVAGYVLGMFGFPSFTIARTLDNPYLDRFINRFRGSTGQYILPKQGCAPQVQAVLNAGGTLSLLGDQHAGDKGCWVDFLGDRPLATRRLHSLRCRPALRNWSVTCGEKADRCISKSVWSELLIRRRGINRFRVSSH